MGLQLSPAEIDILAAVARSLSHDQIAAERRVSVDEVQEHLASAMRKLGATSVIEALIKALRAGFIP